MSDNPLEFVDTNVIVYAHDTSAGEKRARAADLLNRLWEDGNGCISVQVLQEFYVTVTQKIPVPLSASQAAEIITFLSAWKVYAPTEHDVVAAIQLQQERRLSFWDAMIVHCAQKSGCQVLWSEDLNPQNYAELLVRNPFLE